MVVGGQAPAKTPAESPEDFTPPGQVEAAEEQNSATSTTSVLYKKQAEKKRSFKTWFKTRTKKQWLVMGAAAVLVLAGASVGAYYGLKNPPAPPKVATVKKAVVPPAPVPTTVPSNLTGLPVDPSVNERAVTGVMIENSQDARPQSALDQAGVVFEAIAEGGITRFLTLFQDNEPAYIGPVRSVRPYYIQWALGFDAPIAHVGGSPEALGDMKQWNAKNLDQFAGGSYFSRISSRYAPHNVYTSMDRLHQYESAQGYGKSTYTSILRKGDAPLTTPTASSIDFNISGSIYNPHYDYDKSSNTYKRSEGGAPHMAVDQNGGQVQLSPRVVVALVMPQSNNGIYTVYQTIGSGSAYVFQDGGQTQVTWKKDTQNGNFSFTDASGQPFKLNAGQTWFSVVGDSSRVTYK